MAIIPTNSIPISYDNITVVSSTTNSITLNIEENTVSTSVDKFPILINLNTYFNTSTVDFANFFLQLGAQWHKLYVKDGVTNLVVKVELWDDTNNNARIWAIIPTLTTAAKTLVLEFNTATVSNPLSEYMQVVGGYIPEEADAFYYHYFIDHSLNNFVRLDTGELVFGTVYYPGGLDGTTIMTPNGTDPVAHCESNVTDNGWIFSLPSNVYFRSGTGYTDGSHFTYPTCTATEDGEQLEWKIRQALFDEDWLTIVTNCCQDVNNNFVAIGVTHDNDRIAVTTVDGDTWAISDTMVGTYGNDMVILPNTDPTIGGVMVGMLPTTSTYYTMRTSNADASVWTSRGNLASSWSGIAISQYNIIALYYDDKLIVDAVESLSNEYRYAVLTNHGTTYSHDIAMPCLAGWTPCSTVYEDWEVYPHNLFAVDSATETLFGIFSTRNTDEYYGHLFMSDNWGLTWTHVSNFCSVDENASCYYDDECDWQAEMGVKSTFMRCHDGYLTVISESNDEIFQFDLMQILSFPYPIFILYNPTPNSESSSTGQDYFGNAVATSNTYSIVGAYFADLSPSDKFGEAYIFNNSTGELAFRLLNPSPHADDRFGEAVDISESYSIVGARNDDTTASDAGAVYLFDNSDGSLKWTYENPDGTDIHFGETNQVAVNETYSLVGSSWADDGAINAGKLYVYLNSTGVLTKTILNPNPTAYDYFGVVVAMNDNYIVANAKEEVLVFNISDWSLRWTLTSPNATPLTNGDLLAVSDSYVVASDPTYNTASNDRVGQVYVYSNTTGNYLYTITSPIDLIDARFGWSIDCSDDYIIVGSSWDIARSYLFDASDGSLIKELINPNKDIPNDDGSFGLDVGISDDAHCIVGSPEYLNNDTGNYDGRAYLYSV